MKKIDIMLIKELFVLRNYKKYSKRVLTDFCDYIKKQLEAERLYLPYSTIRAVFSYSEFIEEYDRCMLSLSPKDYEIRRDFKQYLLGYKRFIYPEKF